MEDSNEGERTFNKYVSTFVETVDRAASAVHQTAIEIAPPIKTPTPYGGRESDYGVSDSGLIAAELLCK